VSAVGRTGSTESCVRSEAVSIAWGGSWIFLLAFGAAFDRGQDFSHEAALWKIDLFHNPRAVVIQISALFLFASPLGVASVV
jgi:hypothetical protein